MDFQSTVLVWLTHGPFNPILHEGGGAQRPPTTLRAITPKRLKLATRKCLKTWFLGQNTPSNQCLGPKTPKRVIFIQKYNFFVK